MDGYQKLQAHTVSGVPQRARLTIGNAVGECVLSREVELINVRQVAWLQEVNPLHVVERSGSHDSWLQCCHLPASMCRGVGRCIKRTMALMPDYFHT